MWDNRDNPEMEKCDEWGKHQNGGRSVIRSSQSTSSYSNTRGYRTTNNKQHNLDYNNVELDEAEGYENIVSTEKDDNFLHRKDIKFRKRYYTSDGFDIPEKKTLLRKIFSVPVKILSKIAWCIYSLMVHLLVSEKWVLNRSSSSNASHRSNSYGKSTRSGYYSDSDEGSSSTFKHFFFNKNKQSAEIENENVIKRRNVYINNTNNSYNSANNSYISNCNNETAENHLAGTSISSGLWKSSQVLLRKWWKTLAVLLLLALIGFIAFLLWSPISSFASATSEFVGSCLSGFLAKTLGAFSYIGSISLLRSDVASDSSVNVPSAPTVRDNDNDKLRDSVKSVPSPTPPVLTKEDYLAILNRLNILENKLTEHDNKLLMNDDNYNKLKQHLSKVEVAMQEASSKGKTTEQILSEIMHFQLGETGDKRTVTLANFMTLWNEKEKESTESSNSLDLKLHSLTENMVGNEHTSKEKMNEITAEILILKKIQDELKIRIGEAAVAPDVDLDKLRESILPILISEVGTHVKVSCESRECPEPSPGGGHIVGETRENVEKLIKMAIAKYDADKTGRPDLALESAGGTILSTRCTKSSKLRNSVVSFFGFKIWSPPNNPRTIIQPGVVPGECWAFEGSVGDVVIQLVAPSIITGFTMEHIPKSISPYGSIDSAPYKFEVWGLNGEQDYETTWNFGTFSYEDNDEPLQFFEVQNPVAKAYPIVELKILSNHGNLRHTCLYRFRIHGALDLHVANVKIEPHSTEV